MSPGSPGAAGAIILLGHGTRDADGRAEYLALVDAIRAAAPVLVETGWLEFYGRGLPSIPDAIGLCAARGIRRAITVPMLLFHAGHAKADMPRQIAIGAARHPEVAIVPAEALGTHELLLEIAEERARAAEAGLLPCSRRRTALLLVGRGTRDPEANAEHHRIARLLWERNDYAWVEPCFISLAFPCVPEGIRRCVALGARRVVVLPYLINTGTLVKRIGEQALAQRLWYPDVEIVVAGHLGVHPKLVELALLRAAAAEGRPPLIVAESLLAAAGAHRHHHHDDGYDHHHGEAGHSHADASHHHHPPAHGHAAPDGEDVRWMRSFAHEPAGRPGAGAGRARGPAAHDHPQAGKVDERGFPLGPPIPASATGIAEERWRRD